jgi:hypothetical protein
MKSGSLLRKGTSALTLAVLFSVLPIKIEPVAGIGDGFTVATAVAKDGDDDRGSSGRGRGSDDDDDDRRSSNSGRGGGGNDDSDHGRNRGRGGNDDSDDRPTGRLAAPGAAVGGGSSSGERLRVVKVERSASGVEIVYSNGVKEEIENGRYELKNQAGRTVAERSATRADVDRLSGNLRNSGYAAPPTLAFVDTGSSAQPGPGAPGLPSSSRARRIEIAGANIEVRYDTGWKEEIEGGRYELKDPNNNTVVQRPATSEDSSRLMALAGR